MDILRSIVSAHGELGVGLIDIVVSLAGLSRYPAARFYLLPLHEDLAVFCRIQPFSAAHPGFHADRILCAQSFDDPNTTTCIKVNIPSSRCR